MAHTYQRPPTPQNPVFALAIIGAFASVFVGLIWYNYPWGYIHYGLWWIGANVPVLSCLAGVEGVGYRSLTVGVVAALALIPLCAWIGVLALKQRSRSEAREAARKQRETVRMIEEEQRRAIARYNTPALVNAMREGQPQVARMWMAVAFFVACCLVSACSLYVVFS